MIWEVEEDDITKDKETLSKMMGHEGEDHEVVLKENELVLNDGRRMLIRERRQWLQPV